MSSGRGLSRKGFWGGEEERPWQDHKSVDEIIAGRTRKRERGISRSLPARGKVKRSWEGRVRVFIDEPETQPQRWCVAKEIEGTRAWPPLHRGVPQGLKEPLQYLSGALKNSAGPKVLTPGQKVLGKVEPKPLGQRKELLSPWRKKEKTMLKKRQRGGVGHQ